VVRQRRTFTREGRFSCPEHGIYISPSTFEYADAHDNLLWREQEDLQLLAQLTRTKRENRMARERSEDAVTWNVLRALQKADALGSWLESTASLRADRPNVIYWGCDASTGERWPLLDDTRRAFGEPLTKGTEPDVAVVTASTLFFIEAKFTSGNRTRPSEEGRAARYTEGAQGWYAEVMRAGFRDVAIEAQLYELMRMWLLGTWAARRLGTSFCLINLVRDGREESVEEAFGAFIRSSPQRRFKRATWEGALSHVERVQPSHPVTSLLARYMREKSAGYGPNGRLLQAFSA
jgi:hypothetical protein